MRFFMIFHDSFKLLLSDPRWYCRYSKLFLGCLEDICSPGIHLIHFRDTTNERMFRKKRHTCLNGCISWYFLGKYTMCAFWSPEWVHPGPLLLVNVFHRVKKHLTYLPHVLWPSRTIWIHFKRLLRFGMIIRKNHFFYIFF